MDRLPYCYCSNQKHTYADDTPYRYERRSSSKTIIIAVLTWIGYHTVTAVRYAEDIPHRSERRLSSKSVIVAFLTWVRYHTVTVVTRSVHTLTTLHTGLSNGSHQSRLLLLFGIDRLPYCYCSNIR